jgi:hypothetical protein
MCKTNKEYLDSYSQKVNKCFKVFDGEEKKIQEQILSIKTTFKIDAVPDF